MPHYISRRSIHQFFFLLSYGTTNQAFDPTPEQDIRHGQLRTIHDSDGRSRSSFDSLDDEEEEGSITPTPKDQEYINREGKSAFYAPTVSKKSTVHCSALKLEKSAKKKHYIYFQKWQKKINFCTRKN